MAKKLSKLQYFLYRFFWINLETDEVPPWVTNAFDNWQKKRNQKHSFKGNKFFYGKTFKYRYWVGPSISIYNHGCGGAIAEFVWSVKKK